MRSACPCSMPLDANGKCAVCDGALKRPGFRRGAVAKLLRQREQRSNERLLSREDGRDGALRVMAIRRVRA